MSQSSPTLSLPYLQPSQAQKHVTHNEALRMLDAVTQLSVLDATQVDPPSQPQDGDRYIIPPGPSGAWAGKGKSVTVWADGQWHFFQPSAGWRADVIPTGQSLRFDGTTWSEILPELQNLPELGVNTSADPGNRLAVASDATLLTHDGGGHQLKVNKSAVADTASLLFQSNWSGRAEMGTIGSNDFQIKVSPDGNDFHSVLHAEAATGAARFPSGQLYFEDVFILNDTSWSFDVPWSNPARILMWLGVNLMGYYFLVSVTGTQTGAGNFGAMFINPPGGLVFHSGPLNGTTGPAGAINLSLDAAGGVPRMYLENRLGSNRLFTLATLGK